MNRDSGFHPRSIGYQNIPESARLGFGETLRAMISFSARNIWCSEPPEIDIEITIDVDAITSARRRTIFAPKTILNHKNLKSVYLIWNCRIN